MGFLLQWLATTALELTVVLVLILLGWKVVFGTLWARWLPGWLKPSGEAGSKPTSGQPKSWSLIRALNSHPERKSTTREVAKTRMLSGGMFKSLAKAVDTHNVGKPFELSLHQLLVDSSWSPEDLVHHREALSMALKGFVEVATFEVPKNIGYDDRQRVLGIHKKMLSCGNEFGKILASSYVLASQAVSYLDNGINLITTIQDCRVGYPVQEIQAELQGLRNIAEPQAVQSKKVVQSLGLVVTRMSGISAETDVVLRTIKGEKEQAAEKKEKLIKTAKILAGIGALAAATAATGGLIHLAAPGLFFGTAAGAVTAGGVGLGGATTTVALLGASDAAKDAEVQHDHAQSAECALTGGRLLHNNAAIVVKGITGLQVFWKGQVTALDDILRRIDGELGPDQRTVRMLQIDLLLKQWTKLKANFHNYCLLLQDGVNDLKMKNVLLE